MTPDIELAELSAGGVHEPQAHEGPRATFSEWAKGDARMFRAELERTGRVLAARIIADVF